MKYGICFILCLFLSAIGYADVVQCQTTTYAIVSDDGTNSLVAGTIDGKVYRQMLIDESIPSDPDQQTSFLCAYWEAYAEGLRGR